MINTPVRFIACSVVLVGMLLFSSFMTAPARAATLTITTSNQGINPDGECSLTEAILNANEDNQAASTDCPAGSGADVINLNGLTVNLTAPYGTTRYALPRTRGELTVQNGTLDGNHSDYEMFTVGLGSDVTLVDVIVTRGGNLASTGGAVVIINGGTLRVIDSVFSDNTSDSAGSAIYNNNSASTTDLVLHITGSTFVGNVSHTGGAIDSTGGRVLVEDSTFSINEASFVGGAISNRATAAPFEIRNSRFEANSANQGGAITTYNGSNMDVFDSVFINNTANIGGGTMYLTGASDTLVSNSRIYASTAPDGGAIYNMGEVTVINSLLAGNAATTSGGAIYNERRMRVTNSTISGNDAPAGGGIYNENIFSETAIVANSIISGNSSSIVNETVLTVEYSIVQDGFSGTGNLSDDPLFVAPEPFGNAPTAAGDYNLTELSPAIDAGSNMYATNAGVGAVDLGMNPRFVDDPFVADTGEGTPPTVDIGAYEFQVLACDPYETAGYDPYIIGTVNTSLVDDLIAAVQCARLTPGADTIDLNAETLTLEGGFSSFTSYGPMDSATALPLIDMELTLQNGTLLTLYGGRFLAVPPTGDLTLQNMTLRAGTDSTYGGAIYNDGVLTIRDSTFENHLAEYGGVIANHNQATLQNSTFTANTASVSGGVVYNGKDALLTISGSTFSSNEANMNDFADGGGVVYDRGGTITVETSSFLLNTAYNGAVFYLQSQNLAQYSTLQVHQSRLAGNDAIAGVLVHSYYANVKITGSVMTGNRVGYNSGLSQAGAGSGIYDHGGDIELVNNTVSGNVGGGFVRGSDFTSVYMTNNIFWATYPGTGGTWTRSYNIINYPYMDDNPETDLYADPLFVDPASPRDAPTIAGDYRLQPRSPAIDAGKNQAALDAGIHTLDMAGQPRFVDDPTVFDRGAGTAPVIEIGAYEFQETSCTGYTFPYYVSGGQADLGRAIQCAQLNGLDGDVIDLNGAIIDLPESYTDYKTVYYSNKRPPTGLPKIAGSVVLRNGTLDGSNLPTDLMIEILQTADLTLEDITVQNAGYVIEASGQLTITDSTFRNNEMVIKNQNREVVQTISGSLFEGNTITTTGAAPVYNTGSLVIRDSAFINNAGVTGGVIYNYGDVTFVNSELRGNQATQGGIVYTDAFSSPDVYFINSLITGNHATDTGSVYVAEDSPGFAIFVNSTVSGNAAANGVTVQITDRLVSYNSIFYGNSANLDLNPNVYTSSYRYNIIEGFHQPGFYNLDVDPLFVNPVDFSQAPTTAGDYRLQPGSPAIDSGNNDYTTYRTYPNSVQFPDVDLDGNPRFADDPDIPDDDGSVTPVIDRGAYEYISPVVGLDVNHDGIISPTDALYVINRLGSGDMTADVNGDGVIDMADLTAIQQALGTTP